MGTPVVAASIATGLIELGKLGLQMWFQAMRMAGKTKEEMDAMYQTEKEEFLRHAPDTLPEVPPDSDSGAEGEGPINP